MQRKIPVFFCASGAREAERSANKILTWAAQAQRLEEIYLQFVARPNYARGERLSECSVLGYKHALQPAASIGCRPTGDATAA